MEILQDDNLGQTIHNPWVARGWWRTGTLGAKSTEREKNLMRKKEKERIITSKNLPKFFYFKFRYYRILVL